MPSDAEWKTLEAHLGMPASDLDVAGSRGQAQNVGGKLKAVSSLWTSPNTDATDESGFSALPGGNRTYHGAYFLIGHSGSWWSSSEYPPVYAWMRALTVNYGYSTRIHDDKQDGWSVRCLRD